MSDKQNRKRVARLVEAIDSERPAEGLHGGEVETLYNLGTQKPPSEQIPDTPRYLACASEGNCQSPYRSNPTFIVGNPDQVEAWLAKNYVEGWAAHWVLDLDTGEELSWSTTCKFDQDVERVAPRTDPAYTLVGTSGEAGRPYVVTVYTRNGPEAAMTLAHQAFAERVSAHAGELDPPQLQLAAILADAEQARLIDFDLPETWPKSRTAASIVIPTAQEELVAIFGTEAQVSPVGEVPSGVQERLTELRSLLDPWAKVILARNCENCLFAHVEGDSKLDALAFTDDGRVGRGMANLPAYYPTVRELIATGLTVESDDAPVCIERRYLGGFERLTYSEFVTEIVMGDEVAAVVARRLLAGDSPYPWNEDEPEHASQFVLLDAEALRAALSEAEAS
jgi:hypothetical protein